MAASDYVPIFFKNRLYLEGRPQMSPRPSIQQRDIKPFVTGPAALQNWPRPLMSFDVPYHYTLWEAASSPSTQAFMLIGTLFLLPIILMYTAWSYWVFRGKASETLGYH
jgi:hypothetical protein